MKYSNKGINNGNYRHGMRGTRIWNIWNLMKARCINQNNKAYKNYGGRGIEISEKWLSFTGFYEDMKLGYSDDLTLERIDVNGNYCKENCIWIEKKEQNKNTRRNVAINYKGQEYKIYELSEKLGIKYNTLYNRIFIYKIPIDDCGVSGRSKRRVYLSDIKR